MISFNFQHIFKLISVYLFLQTKPEPRVLTNATDAFINHVLADWNSAGGLGVAVVRKNEQGLWNIETRGYGIATLDGRKVTEHTLFSIGSNSKVSMWSFLCWIYIQLTAIAFQCDCYRVVNPRRNSVSSPHLDYQNRVHSTFLGSAGFVCRKPDYYH